MSTKSVIAHAAPTDQKISESGQFELKNHRQELETSAISLLGTPMGSDCMRALEPRILLDAAGGETFAAALDSDLMQLAQAQYAPTENSDPSASTFEKSATKTSRRRE